jgi:branched-subunit amino acid transport protein
VSEAWLVVVLVGGATVVIKAAGPVLLGGRALPGPVNRMIVLLAPAILAALVAWATFGLDRKLVIDERVLGIAAAAIAIWFRAPLLVVVIVAGGVTALARALT